MGKIVLLLLVHLVTVHGFSGSAQPGPSIGVYSLPGDADLVCTIPLRTGGNFDLLGYQISDTVPDFTMFDINSDSVNLKTALQSGLPVLLITCSYTCPVYREHLVEVNDLQSEFGNDILIYLVYTVEAHPIVDISPYFGYVKTTQENYDDNILYEQPETYGGRKQMVSDMLSQLQVNVPVLIDGPCNNFWINYECGANTAYLIRMDGVIFSKHGWFNQAPDNMKNDINILLGNGNGDGTTYNGHFEFTLTNDSMAIVNPGETAYLTGTFKNTSNSQGVLIEISKAQQTLPADWNASICTDVCYSPDQDSITLYLYPGTSQTFKLDFYTSMIADSGDILMRFRNYTFPDEVVTQNFKVVTNLNTAIGFSVNSSLSIFPNPSTHYLTVKMNPEALTDQMILLYNEAGEVMFSQKIETNSEKTVLDLRGQKNGIYFLKAGNLIQKIVKQ
ncbi:MAG: T9SS type A sorting domain-containing protein [Chitinophagales bacterium]